MVHVLPTYRLLLLARVLKPWSMKRVRNFYIAVTKV